MIYTIYDPVTGQIIRTLTTADPVQAQVNLQGQNYINGRYNNQYYIDQNQAVLKTPDPSTDTQKYSFDYATKTWQVDSDLSQQAIIDQRDKLMESVSAVSAVQYSLLTTQQQQELQTYYQALLAVPNQLGFPNTVSWPTKPGWL